MEEKIYTILKQNPELVFFTKFLLKKGAGSLMIFPKGMKTEIERILAWELADSLALERSGSWGYEIAQMVLNQNIERMKKIASELFVQDPRCPECNWSARIAVRKKRYICRKCKAEWSF